MGCPAAAAAALWLCVVLIAVTRGEAVRCFVCSWSPRDQANRSDHCTHANFDPEKNFAHDCEHGCEFYSQNDLNGDFEHVRRNCAPSDPPHKGCLSESSRAWTTVRCICNSDYCNAASKPTSISLVVLWTTLTLTLAAVIRPHLPT
ncbi:uncharacterized protein LOC8029720 [Ixodes scapularis]|nr:uncharacterized protein LOC8029720 [Ixodes scapularis]